ncbi:hypothetical protein SLH46_01870 [Draconibacterium sp. IB214405]|uniref:hypothetical protein n=1 Tax=Draconibacterium sp. IB214405 TaxID=3097352 RepID=UPI002A15E76F|nr:hypothetical protein [Draconibacterium sp. IB214405]MDX8337910.1 hypothetical protein [Draconibacterium sp. IB214405]
MKRKWIVAALVSLLLSACIPTMKYTWTKENYTAKKFDNILVLAITQNMEARTIFENTIVKALEEEGFHAENSLKLFPPIVSIEKISEEGIESKIKASDYDAVIVSSLVDVKAQEVYDYVDYYRPYPYFYPRHIYYGYGYAYRPGYYRQETSFVVESRLFDTSATTKEDAIVWSGQSELIDPVSYESGAKDHAYSMVKTLLKSGVLQQP